MTHTLVISGTASGGVAPRALTLDKFTNTQQFGTILLEYVASNTLTLDKFLNVSTYDDVELENVAVTELTLTKFDNVTAFDGVELEALPFDPDNAETDTLLAVFTGTYSTTAKIQMDTLITELKDAGVWTKLDWFGIAHWAVNEHDALINWIIPAETLVKVGGATWTLGAGLSGVNPMINSGRYKSGWNMGDGPNSGPTDFCIFVNITAIASPQNGMQPIGCFELNTPGPSAPNGSFISLSIPGNGGSSGANVLPFNGNTSFAVGDGLGVWATSRIGGTNKTIKNGAELESDSVAGTATYTHADGICVAGSAPGFGAQKSFPGTELYWGWGEGLTAVEMAAVQAAYITAQSPPGSGGEDGLDVGGGDYLDVDGSGNFLKVQ